jgi:ATP-dependent Clp protease adapter protein ClpS
VLVEVANLSCHAREVLADQGVTRSALLDYVAHGVVRRADAAPLPLARLISEAARGVTGEPTPPARYEVVIHDDVWTTRAFVVEVLESVFDTRGGEADALIEHIQTTGSAAVAIHDLKTANAKLAQVTRMARAKEFPLLLSIRPAP